MLFGQFWSPRCSCVTPFSRLVMLVLELVGYHRRSPQSPVCQGVVLSLGYLRREQDWWSVAPGLQLEK